MAAPMDTSPSAPYDYDLIVVGGGSGGLACSKKAAGYGKKVCVLDFVKPSPQGTAWGLGGTCVNVGCIPKKLMHQASLLGDAIQDASAFGWKVDKSQIQHDWAAMVTGVQDHIGSLNWNYRVSLRDKNVTYLNAYGVFTGPHSIQCTDKKGKVTNLTAEKFVIAVGGRPRYPDIPGAKELGITSDDLFSLAYPPGKTLVVGASYVALECAGFLTSLGYDATVMARSIFLRGFDQQCAELIVEYMASHGTKFLRRCVPTKLERVEPTEPDARHKIRVTWQDAFGDGDLSDVFDTVLFAVGRDAITGGIGLDKVGVQLEANGKINAVNEQSNVDYIYAIGDVLNGRPELTPVAILAGRLLASRLFGGASVQMDYTNIATTVFTPIEYGCIGLSEEDAHEKHGEESIEVFHQFFQPLEWTVAHRENNACYAKLVCLKTESMRVIGLHIVGPNAGEITQGYAVAFKFGATKEHFDSTVGIHPTCSENFTTMDITKSSGVDPGAKGC